MSEDGELCHLISVKVLLLLYLCLCVCLYLCLYMNGMEVSINSEDGEVSHLIRVKVLILLLHHLRSWDSLLFKLAFCLDLL